MFEIVADAEGKAITCAVYRYWENDGQHSEKVFLAESAIYDVDIVNLAIDVLGSFSLLASSAATGKFLLLKSQPGKTVKKTSWQNSCNFCKYPMCSNEALSAFIAAHFHFISFVYMLFCALFSFSIFSKRTILEAVYYVLRLWLQSHHHWCLIPRVVMHVSQSAELCESVWCCEAQIHYLPYMCIVKSPVDCIGRNTWVHSRGTTIIMLPIDSQLLLAITQEKKLSWSGLVQPQCNVFRWLISIAEIQINMHMHRGKLTTIKQVLGEKSQACLNSATWQNSSCSYDGCSLNKNGWTRCLSTVLPCSASCRTFRQISDCWMSNGWQLRSATKISLMTFICARMAPSESTWSLHLTQAMRPIWSLAI